MKSQCWLFFVGLVGAIVLSSCVPSSTTTSPTASIPTAQSPATDALTAAPKASSEVQMAEPSSVTPSSQTYIGMWVTQDGYIRHELLPNNRYDEARGDRESAYQGRYEITGNRINYWDDTGFTADGEFRDGVLYHAGYVFHREENK